MIDDFRTLADGESELGFLDSPSFLATLLGWVVTSYSRAFDEVESTLEEFDVSVLGSPGSDTEGQITAADRHSHPHRQASSGSRASP